MMPYYIAEIIDFIYYSLDFLLKVAILFIAVKYLEISEHVRTFLRNRKNRHKKGWHTF